MSDISLEQELEIVWTEDITEIDYVRESNWGSTDPYGKQPESNAEQRIIGYAVLKPGLKRGNYRRRLFLLRPQDRYLDPNGTYKTGCPSEAVDPRTVQVGVAGYKTPRAKGYSASNAL